MISNRRRSHHNRKPSDDVSLIYIQQHIADVLYSGDIDKVTEENIKEFIRATATAATAPTK